MALIPTGAAPIDYRRRMAYELMKQGTDTAPIDHWTQGLAKLGQGALGGYQMYRADQKDKETEREGAQAYISLLQGGGPAAAAGAPVDSPAVPMAPPTSGKIYSNDEPSPLDPPSGQDRTRMLATILGESANQPAEGQNAVASVIRNRAVNGGYGGDTPSGVVTAPNQFEPWNTPEGRQKMAAMVANPQLAAKADQAISQAYGEGGQAPNDPTGGAKNFIEPKLQTALGRPMPAWAQQPGTMIGDHKFIGGAQQAPYQVAGPPTADPASLPPGAQQAQGYAIPGQDADPRKAQIIQLLQGTPAQQKIGKALADQVIGQQFKPETTDEIKEYNLAKKQGFAGSFFDFKSGLKKAGAVNVTTNIEKPELAFDTEAGKLQAKRFDELASEGQTAKQMVSDISTLTDLGKNIGTGKSAEFKALIGPYAENLGIKMEGLSDIQAYEAVVNRIAPNLRVKGSGAQSDLELKNFLKSLPSLGNTPEGNQIASTVLTGLQENKIRAAEIGSKAMSKEITRSEAEKQLRDLPDPMSGYREYMKTNRGAPTAAGTKAAPTVINGYTIKAR